MKIKYKILQYRPNTIGWYLDRIEDEEIREKALKNTSPDRLHLRALNPSNALFGAFGWMNTPESGEYWANIYNKLEENEDHA